MVKKPIFILTLASISVLITPLVIAEDLSTSAASNTANTAETTATGTDTANTMERKLKMTATEMSAEKLMKSNTFEGTSPAASANSPRLWKTKEEYQEMMITRKAEREQTRETKMTEFKAQLETIKDEQKKEIVERVNARMANVNENRIAAWTKVLEQFASILERIKAKTATLKDGGADVATVETEITEAEVAIAAAQVVLDTQATKDYTLTLSDESSVRTDVSTLKDTLKTDLKTVHTAIKSAHQATREAAATLHAVQKPAVPETAESAEEKTSNN